MHQLDNNSTTEFKIHHYVCKCENEVQMYAPFSIECTVCLVLSFGFNMPSWGVKKTTRIMETFSAHYVEPIL